MATGPKKPRDPSERVARRLLAEGRITRDLHDAAMRQRQINGMRFEEAMIEVGVPEEQVLRLLAETYRVQYISTAKLQAVQVDKRTLALVPAQIAEHRQIFPVMLDRQRSVLSVATSDPDDVETLKELEIATQARTIKPLLARPAAIAAALAKYYHGDDFAFSLLQNENFDVARGMDRDPLSQMQMPAGESLLNTQGLAAPARGPQRTQPGAPPPPVHAPQGPAPSSPHSYAMPVPHPAPNIHVTPGMPPVLEAVPSPRLTDPSHAAPRPLPAGATRPATLSAPPLPRAAADPRRTAPLTPPPPPPAAQGELSPVPAALSSSPAHSSLPPAPARSVPPVPASVAPSANPRMSSAPPADPSDRAEVADAALRRTAETIGDPFQLAAVMVSLLEGNRKDLRGHSIQTARLVRKVCEKFNVPPTRARAAEIAALVHDVGKASSYHLTLYNVARFDGHLAAAQKLYATPGRVMESARLAKAALAAVTHMYERYDGAGFPDGLNAAKIPLESRILAVCDSYTDLTSNPKNSFRRVLSAQEASEALRELQGSVFDPKVVDRLARVVLGDEVAQRLRGELGLVLLVDPDVEETTVLELALLEKRYDVCVVRTIDEALQFVESTEVDIVVSEMKLDPGDGFALLQKLRQAKGDATPFVFLSDVTDGAKVTDALDAGAADYLFKPLAAQVIVAKIRRLLEQSQSARGVRGVSGSLEEMSIPDIVQILHQGRKTGALRLSTEGQEGSVFFKEGIVVDTVFRDLRGEEAFYAIVGIEKGDFRIDPGAAPDRETVHASPEMLLLEGMRRLDEAGR